MGTTARSVLAGVICAGALLAAGAPAASAATFTVNSNADTSNPCPGATCTLRGAIAAANAATGPHTITFSAGFTFTPATPLPDIEEPVTIVGDSDGDCAAPTNPANIQTLDGNGGDYDGLTFADGSGGSRVCRFSIIHFGTSAQVGNGVVVEADDVTVDGNLIGVTTSDTAAGNNNAGVYVLGADDVQIGGPTNAERNRIADNGNGSTGVGIVFLGAVDGAHVENNFIGTNVGGTAALGTQSSGLVENGATNSLIEENVISGNAVEGVSLTRGTLRANLIGVDRDGTSAVPNGTSGVNVASNAVDPVIGGTAASDRNVISGNGRYGILAAGPAAIHGNLIGPGLDAGTEVALAGSAQEAGVRVSADDVTVGGTGAGEGNVIGGHTTGAGIETSGIDLTGVAIEGNRIGVGSDDTTAFSNGTGVRVSGATGTRVGGTAPGAGNVIAGNTTGVFAGVGIEDLATNTVIEGNTIGLNAAGDMLRNGAGIILKGDGTRIGGTAAAARNVISGNGDPLGGLGAPTNGITVGQDTTGVVVEGNHIGLGPDGTTERPNVIGIRMDKTTDARIGGTAPGAGNVISANLRNGISIAGGQSTAPVVEGNLIGTDATGTQDRGNGQNGVFLTDATNARIGGTTAAARNVISGNGFSGVQAGVDTGGSVVQGNLIGVAQDGTTALPNDLSGVDLAFLNGPFTVGGTAPGAGNVIARNTSDGVKVTSATGATILGNAMVGNGATADDLGIDLGDDGVTPNDLGDADDATVANRGQNFPVITGAQTDGAGTGVTGTVDTTPGATVRVEVFAVSSCDPSGHGEGETFLGATQFTAQSGATPFAAEVAPTTAGAVTATATDLATGDTSEFSTCAPTSQRVTIPVAPSPATPIPAPTPAPAPAAASAPAPPPAAATPKNPAKLRVLRAGITGGKLDMLVEITARAVTPGAKLSFDYEAAGRHTRFTVPITGTQVKVLQKLPAAQAKLDTGIVTVTYAGNDIVNPDEVRLRAASGKAKLVRTSSSVRAGTLKVAGTIASAAKGVVRIRMEYTKADGSTGLLTYQAKIGKGTWSLTQKLPAEAAGGGQLSIQFTGYLPEELRGEQTAKQVLA